MMAAAKNEAMWLEHNGKVVTLDGVKCKLAVDAYKAIYPYEHRVLRVFAEPIDKQSAEYQRVKSDLGDDWSTDVLGSDVEVISEILSQLES